MEGSDGAKDNDGSEKGEELRGFDVGDELFRIV